MKVINKIFILQFIFFILSCHAQSDQKDYKNAKMLLPNGAKINLEIVYSLEAQSLGLSGRKDNELKKDEGMLFYYKEFGPRRFWMPDTYIDLDIFFLDEDYKVLDIERDMKSHPGKAEPPVIPKTRVIYAQHVLELRADSSISKKIIKGMKLKLVD